MYPFVRTEGSEQIMTTETEATTEAPRLRNCPPLQVRIKPELFAKIRERAKRQGLSISELVRGAIIQELRRKKLVV